MPGGTHLRQQLDLVVAEHVEAAAHDRFDRRAVVVAHSTREREHLFVARPARRHRLPVAIGMGVGERGGESQAAGLDRFVQQRDHLVDLGVGGLLAYRCLAHHIPADRAVAHEEAGIHRDPAFEAVEELAEGVPVPRDALFERGERHALDLRHHAARVIGGVGLQRREREAAVAADHTGDAVHVRRRGVGIPMELRVVVRVRVDEARCEHETVAVDGGGRGVAGERARFGDGGDAVAADTDVGRPGGRARAVDEGRSDDLDVEHGKAASAKEI